METKHKILFLMSFFINALYIVWLYFNYIGVFGFVFFVAETLLLSLTLLFLVNHWKQDHLSGNESIFCGDVDVFIPVVNESIQILENTVMAADQIDYKRKKIYILDDGRRNNVRLLANKYSVTYLRRNDKLNHAKAGNLNYGLKKSKSDFILVLDADQAPSPDIIKDLLGYFHDKDVALVSTKQSFEASDGDFNHDALFYNHMQAGKNSDNAAISCGSGVIYRRSALDEIGGFQTWNIVEDMYTSYVMHKQGFKSVYVNRAYARGIAPQDLPSIYKQRGLWAEDSLRLLFRNNLFFSRKLSFRQKLHYFELAWVYVVSGLVLPIIFLAPIISLFFNVLFVNNPHWYIVLRIPSLLLVLYSYYFLSGNTFSNTQYWASLCFVYARSLFRSLFLPKARYDVTKKYNGKKFKDIVLIWPHAVLVLLGIVAIAFYASRNGYMDPFLMVNSIWIFTMFFWFYPIFKKALMVEKASVKEKTRIPYSMELSRKIIT